MVGAIVVEVVVVPQAGWERVGFVVVVVVVQWSLEEACRGERVVGTQSGPAFCVFQLLVLLKLMDCSREEGRQGESDEQCEM